MEGQQSCFLQLQGHLIHFHQVCAFLVIFFFCFFVRVLFWLRCCLEHLPYHQNLALDIGEIHHYFPEGLDTIISICTQTHGCLHEGVCSSSQF